MPLTTHSGVGLFDRPRLLIHCLTKFLSSYSKPTLKNLLLYYTMNYIHRCLCVKHQCISIQEADDILLLTVHFYAMFVEIQRERERERKWIKLRTIKWGNRVATLYQGRGWGGHGYTSFRPEKKKGMRQFQITPYAFAETGRCSGCATCLCTVKPKTSTMISSGC